MSERLEDLKDQSKTNELLKRYCDVQSTRIDLLEKRLDRLEAREDLQFKMIDLLNIKIKRYQKILSRYQMTENQEAQTDIDKIKEIPEGRKDQDLIDKKWREVSELGI